MTSVLIATWQWVPWQENCSSVPLIVVSYDMFERSPAPHTYSTMTMSSRATAERFVEKSGSKEEQRLASHMQTLHLRMGFRFKIPLL